MGVEKAQSCERIKQVEEQEYAGFGRGSRSWGDGLVPVEIAKASEALETARWSGDVVFLEYVIVWEDDRAKGKRQVRKGKRILSVGDSKRLGAGNPNRELASDPDALEAAGLTRGRLSSRAERGRKSTITQKVMLSTTKRKVWCLVLTRLEQARNAARGLSGNKDDELKRVSYLQV
jgi:hypothetical protein